MAVKKTTDAAEVAENEQVTEQKADTAENGAGFCVYIGPSIMGVIQCNTIYPGGKDDALAREEVQLAVSKYPSIAGLIVDGKDLAASIEKIKTHGEALWKTAHDLTKQ